jgi:hypothetical protein
MTPERMAVLVARWVRLYTRDLPSPIAGRRIDEIEADLHDQIAHDRATGVSDRRIAFSILSRMVRGVTADVAWRDEHANAIIDEPSTPGGPMKTNKTAYLFAIGAALGAALFLLWGVAAMGVVGAEGDRFDLLYIGVLAVGIVGAVIARFRPLGMVRALLAMALAQALVGVTALATGKHESPVSSVAEIVGLNGLYVALFVGSAWLFRRAARQHTDAHDEFGQ